MNLLCIHFGVSKRILAFIHFIKSNYSITLNHYNVFNEQEFLNLKNKEIKLYDGIILLGVGREETLLKVNDPNDNSFVDLFQSKCHLDCVKKYYPKILDLINQLITLNHRTPILGICYGAQVLNNYYGGSLSYVPDSGIQGNLKTWYGNHCVLFKNIKGEYFPLYNHNFIMENNHSKIIAVNESSNINSGFQYTQNHFSLAFHLQHSDEKGYQVIDNFISLMREKKPTLYLYIMIILLVMVIILNYFFSFKNLNKYLIIFLIIILFETFI